MKAETENAVRSILALDPEVSHENLEKAMRILWGKCESNDDLVHVLRYKEVTDLLHIHPRTLEYYVSRGYLDRVYGMGGVRALGISRESFIRFTTERRVVRCCPQHGGGKSSDASAPTEVSLRLASSFRPNNLNRTHRKSDA